MVTLKAILNNYDDIHRRLVQYTMKKGYITVSKRFVPSWGGGGRGGGSVIKCGHYFPCL